MITFLQPATRLAMACLLTAAAVGPAMAAEGLFEDGFTPSTNNGATVLCALAQPNGKILLGGDFTSINGVSRPGLARVRQDGTLENEFNLIITGTFPGQQLKISSMALQTDGRIVIAGTFTTVSGTARRGVARLLPTGQLDTTFAPSAVDGYGRTVLIQPDGRVVVGGAFRASVGTGAADLGVIRLTTTGAVDSTFTPPSLAPVNGLALQGTGAIVIGGQFTVPGPTQRLNIARLDSNGAVDADFHASCPGSVDSVTGLLNSKMILTGTFTDISGVARAGFGRIHADGSVDTDFAPDIAGSVKSVLILQDGRMIIAGSFTAAAGEPAANYARLLPDGGRDITFTTAPPVGNTPLAMTMQMDGKVVVAGSFTTAGGLTRRGVARVDHASPQTLTIPNSTSVVWQQHAMSQAVISPVFEQSINGGSAWTALTPVVKTATGWQVTGLNLPANCEIRARGRTAGSSQNTGLADLLVTRGTSTPALAVQVPSGTTLPFGSPVVCADTAVNTDSAQTQVFLRNTGQGSLAIDDLQISGPHSSEFQLDLTGTALSVNRSSVTSFRVRCRPAAKGPRTATLRITPGGGLPVRDIPLSGSGAYNSEARLSNLTTSAGALTPPFSLIASAYQVTVPHTQATTSVTPTLMDTTATMKVNQVPAVSGATVQNIPLAYGTNFILVDVTAENGVNFQSYTLTVNRPAPAPDISLQVQDGPALANGHTLRFEDTADGGRSSFDVVVSNSPGATAALTGLTLAISGRDETMYSLSRQTLPTIAAGGSATFNVKLAPTGLGTKIATLRITSNDPDENPTDIFLFGNCIPPTSMSLRLLPPASIQPHEVTLAGQAGEADSPREVFFEYGPSENYGSRSPAPDHLIVAGEEVKVVRSVPVLPHTRYHYRMRAEGRLGTVVTDDGTFTSANTQPQAVTDEFAAAPGTITTLDVVANDTDADADALTLTSFTQVPAAAGKVVKVDNQLVFTASATFASASLTYTISDGFGGGATGMVILGEHSAVLYPVAKAQSAQGGTHAVAVQTPGAWAASESLPWLTVGPAGGSGYGTAFVTLQPNTTKAARTGQIKIAGAVHTVVQAGVLKPDLAPLPQPVPPAIVSRLYTLPVPVQNLPVTFIATGLPPGLKADGAARAIKGVPNKPGTYRVTLKAQNAAGPAPQVLIFDITVLDLHPAVTGIFHGLVERSPHLNNNLASRLELVITRTGVCTGRLISGTTPLPFAGQLLADPDLPDQAGCTFLIPRKGTTPLFLEMTLDATGAFAGMLVDSASNGAGVTGWRNGWSRTAKVPAYYRRLHTFVLEQPDTNPALPQGFGYGSIPTINETTGAVTVSGRLADGGTFATASFLGPHGQFLIYQPLYASKGSLAGVLTLKPHDSAIPDNSISGAPTWYKPANSKEILYRDGFGPLLLTAEGGAYPLPAPGGVVMGLPDDVAGNARLGFTLPGADVVTLDISLSNPGAALINKAVIPANVNKVTMPVLNAATGAFSGSLVIPGATAAADRKAAWQGLIVKRAAGVGGYGYFLMPESTAAAAQKHSGAVMLRAVGE